MVQSIAHIAEYICVPNLKNILDGSEHSAYSRYICVPNLKSILDGSEYSAYSRVHMCYKLKDHFGDSLVITHINFGYLH